MSKSLPNLQYEKKLWQQGYLVIGLDEVGRGSLAGPLFVGAVCFKIPVDKNERLKLQRIGINDSKQLKPQQRQKLVAFIQDNCFAATIASCPVSFINKKGIVQATQKAMRQAIAMIQAKTHPHKLFVLVDAFEVKYVCKLGPGNQLAIITGDEKSLSIAAASIIAKVARDKLMRSLSRQYPAYLWGRNKGYGTQKHIQAIKANGPTSLHRNLFLRKILH